MSDTLERRVETLEAEVRKLAEEVRKGPGPNDWKKTFGVFRDSPLFEEAMRLGREYREKQKPDSGS